MNDYEICLGIALRMERESQQRLLRDVSTQAYMSLGYLSEIERGAKSVSSTILDNLCRALDISVPDILDRTVKLMRESSVVYS